MEKFFFKKVEVWVVLLLAVFGFIAMIIFGSITRNVAMGYDRYGKLGKIVYALASVPTEAKNLLTMKDLGGMTVQEWDRFPGKAGWTFDLSDPAALPDGYLLFSRYDGDQKHHVAEWIDLRTGKRVYRVDFDADTLLKGAKRDSKLVNFDRWTTRRFRSIHPFPLPNGDMIVKDHASPLLRVNACGQKIWRQEVDLFHHSTEMAADGTLWVPTHIEPVTVAGAPPNMHDDGMAKVTMDGEVLFNRSLASVMLKQGMGQLLFRTGTDNKDPTHINDIQPVLSDGPYWKKGDVFLSLRNMSAVILYRPSTDKIIWIKMGPWSAQHDVDIINDHTIAVFNNNVLNRGYGGEVVGSSEILFYDFATGEVSNPYKALFDKYDIRTKSEGLFILTPAGHLLIEEHDAGRFLIFSPQGKLVAENVNRAVDGKIYNLGWSRYVPREKGEEYLKAARAQTCKGS